MDQNNKELENLLAIQARISKKEIKLDIEKYINERLVQVEKQMIDENDETDAEKIIKNVARKYLIEELKDIKQHVKQLVSEKE